MKRTALIWTGIVLMGIALGAIVSIFQSHNVIGGPIVAAIFGAAAWRTWYIAGDSTKPPTEVEG